MDIQTSKLKLMKTILEIESSELLNKISDLIKSEEPDFWNELNNEQQAEIQKGIDQLDNGQRVSFKSALKRIS